MQIDYHFANKLPEKEQELAKKTCIKANKKRKILKM